MLCSVSLQDDLSIGLHHSLGQQLQLNTEITEMSDYEIQKLVDQVLSKWKHRKLKNKNYP